MKLLVYLYAKGTAEKTFGRLSSSSFSLPPPLFPLKEADLISRKKKKGREKLVPETEEESLFFLFLFQTAAAAEYE